MRKKFVITILASVILVGYCGFYFYLRWTNDLIHRYTTGDGNKIVPGDWNPGLLLLSPDPPEAAAAIQRKEDAVMAVFWPLRFLESKWHDCTYQYRPMPN